MKNALVAIALLNAFFLFVIVLTVTGGAVNLEGVDWHATALTMVPRYAVANLSLVGLAFCVSRARQS